MGDEQDRAEAIDEEEVDPEFPPERPLGLEGTQAPDSFAGRSRQETPERARPDAPVIQPYAEDDLVDDEGELVADAAIDERDPEADGQLAPAEEAAMHIEP